MTGVTAISELVPLLTGPFSHLELGQVNDHAAYVMKFEGSFPMHAHTRDEMYVVLEGEIFIDFKIGPRLVVRRGESTVVRAYTTHSSGSVDGALVLMIKPKEMFLNPSELE